MEHDSILLKALHHVPHHFKVNYTFNPQRLQFTLLLIYCFQDDNQQPQVKAVTHGLKNNVIRKI